MKTVTLSKNRLFFGFIILGYLFGVFLYDLLGFTYTDELMALFLVFFLIKAWTERRAYFMWSHLAVLAGYFLFQTVYSLAIGSNVPQAILMDGVIQMKPFLGFYGAFILMPMLTKADKRALTILTLVAAGVLLIIGLTGNIRPFFGHPSRFATAATITAVLYLYCSSFSWADTLVFIAILAIGFFSTRTKFYGFFALAAALVVAVQFGYRFRISLPGVLFIVSVLLLVLYVAWPKIELYYFYGALRSESMWARPTLYLTATSILTDYIPFGSGWASFATFTSGLYYSDLYAHYSIDKIWGLSREMPDYISDTYYPALAQVGFFGIALFSLFWYAVIRRLKNYRSVLSATLKEYFIVVLTILFFAIESTSDSTFTHNRGLMMMIIMGLCMANIHTAHGNLSAETQTTLSYENNCTE